MSDLINRADAIKAVWMCYQTVCERNIPQDRRDLALTDTMQTTLSILPSADTVEIVRCKECKEWNEYARDKLGRCDCHLITTSADDFCSYGERSEE